MKLVRYGDDGDEKPGLVAADDSIRDLSGEIDDIAGDVLSARGLAKLAALDPMSLPAVSGSPRLGPPVGRVSKLIGIGLNYEDHARESGLPVPEEPILFMKAISSLSGPNDDVVLPPHSTKPDHEVELAIIIGQTATNILNSIRILAFRIASALR